MRHAHARFRCFDGFGPSLPGPAWAGLLHATGRRGGHGGRHGGGAGGPFGGGFDGDPDDFRRGRTFRSDDLQLLLLALIEEQPRHGYELIKALDARSNGAYSPSPGMVYPALTYLEELSYVTVELDGTRKRYALADAGRAFLDAQRDRVQLLLAKLEHVARRMEMYRRAMAGNNDYSDLGWVPELVEARRALKEALVRRVNADAAEQQRIAAILRRATADIESGAQG